MSVCADLRVGAIAKTRRDFIVVQLRSDQARTYLDVRQFYQPPKGEMQPTSKGIAIAPALIPELLALLRRAETEARQRGLVSSDHA